MATRPGARRSRIAYARLTSRVSRSRSPVSEARWSMISGMGESLRYDLPYRPGAGSMKSSRNRSRDKLLDQRDQLLFVVRLAEVVVGAELQRQVAVLLRDPRRDHDDRQVLPA